MLQPGQSTIAIHILCNISSKKGNKTIKFCQLIEYNIRNIFQRKSYIKCDGEANPRPLSKKSKLSICLNHSLSRVLYSLFSLYAMLGAI